MWQQAAGLISDECGPNASGLPDCVHEAPSSDLIASQHLSLPTVEESRHPHVGDAMNMHWFAVHLGHGITEAAEVLFGRTIKFHGNVDVGYAKASEACGFIRQSFLMRM